MVVRRKSDVGYQWRCQRDRGGLPLTAAQPPTKWEFTANHREEGTKGKSFEL
jgi:hypothetical protein